MKILFCTKCGKELPSDACFCLYCGQSMNHSDEQPDVTMSELQQPNPVQSITPSKPKKSGKKVAIALLIIAGVLVGLLFVGFLGLRAVHHVVYKQQLQETYELLDQSETLAESFCSLQSSVWQDSIYQTTRDSTKKYTKNAKGKFYDDFNDALESFYEGEKESLEAIVLASQAIDEKMSLLKNPPSKYEEEYQSIKEMYFAYSELVALAFGNSSHSLNSFSEALSDATKAFRDAKVQAKTIL